MNGEPQNIRTAEPQNAKVQSRNCVSLLLHSAVRMFECSAVRCFFAVVLLSLTASSISAAQAATIAPSATTAPGSVTEDVRRNIQELLKADAAAMAADPASTHVLVPKLPAFLPAQIKRPAPATQPALAAAKPQPATQPAVDPELEKLRHTKLANPVAAADGFFKAGRLAEAAILYEQALAGDQAPDKDWALLQLGVCKEQTDPQAAVALYGRLLAECASSPWRQVATARQNSLQWLIAQDVPNLLKNAADRKSK